MNKRALLLGALLVAGGLGGYVAYTTSNLKGHTTLTESTPPATASPAFNFLAIALPDASGQMQAVQQWQGKVLVLNYWATWCPPCRQEMPMFSTLHERYAAQGVQFVGLSIDTADKVTEFQKTNPVAYPLLIAPMNALEPTAALGNETQGLPFTVVLDRNGHIAATKLGRFSESDLERLIKQLI